MLKLQKSHVEPQYWIDSALVDFALAIVYRDEYQIENFQRNLDWVLQEVPDAQTVDHVLWLREQLKRILVDA